MKYILYEYKGNDVGQSLPLQNSVDIGREERNEFQIIDDKVSRVHARISVIDNQFFLEDMGSRNGTYVNGQAISKTTINPGDTIEVGDTGLLIKEVPLHNLSDSEEDALDIKFISDATMHHTKIIGKICHWCTKKIDGNPAECPHCGCKLS